MATRLWSDNAVATLASGITNSDTSIPLATGKGALFPSPTGGDYFMLTLTQAGSETSWETVKVTARTSDTLTAVRAQEGTSAAAWSAADKAELRITKGFLTDTPIGGGFPTAVVVVGTSQTATAGNHYILSNVAATALTLPASPANGDLVMVTVANDLATNTVDPGSNTITGPAGTGTGVMTVDAVNASFILRYIDSTIQWRVV